jgi:hypothetical protein
MILAEDNHVAPLRTQRHAPAVLRDDSQELPDTPRRKYTAFGLDSVPMDGVDILARA